MADTIDAFKRLPRPQTTPTGLPNHWIFRSRHVPLEPPGDLVVVVHPQSKFQLTAGPVQIPQTMSIKEKAEMMLPYILDAFLKGVQDDTGRLIAEAKAPWSWSTDDPALAAALEPLFHQLGLHEDLCVVTICSEEERSIINDCWSTLITRLLDSMGLGAQSVRNQPAIQASGTNVQLGDQTKCHSCQKDRSETSSPLLRCSGCGKAWYCSPQCQKAHWKKHKPTCLANRSSKGSSSGGASVVDAFTYYNTTAHKSAEAKNLAASLNLTLPSTAGAREGTMLPLRRLVVTGKDTAVNMQLLFGPQWRDDLLKTYDEVRAQVLMNPPPGSPAYLMAAHLDKDGPGWSPRPPSESEERNIAEVRRMQAAIRERVGSGTSPTNTDMQAILLSFGPDWTQYLPLYQLAANTMDQGVGPR